MFFYYIMSSWFDLSSIVGLQRSIISDLSNNSAVINNLDVSLNALNNALSAANTNVLPTLTYQNDVNAILERENTRLDERKQAIDIAETGQRRMIELTNSATLKKQAINNMYVVVVVALLIYLGIKMLSNILPEIVADILTIILMSITIIILIKKYSDLSKRNNMDYNTIDFSVPVDVYGNSVASSSSTQSNLLDFRLNGCVKESCCSEGTTFNNKYSICVPNLPPFSASAPLGYASFKYFVASKSWLDPKQTCSTNEYSLDDLSCNAIKQGFANMGTSDSANPNGPNEFVDYNLYK
jgi:hypothetical protein